MGADRRKRVSQNGKKLTRSGINSIELVNHHSALGQLKAHMDEVIRTAPKGNVRSHRAAQTSIYCDQISESRASKGETGQPHRELVLRSITNRGKTFATPKKNKKAAKVESGKKVVGQRILQYCFDVFVGRVGVFQNNKVCTHIRYYLVMILPDLETACRPE